MDSSYDKDNLESVLTYLISEYGIEILAGQGKIPGKHDVMNLLPDFLNTTRKGDYSMIKMMKAEGILSDLVSLKVSGASPDNCCRTMMLGVQKLADNFIRDDVAENFVNMTARVIGLNVSVSRSVKTSPAAPLLSHSRPAATKTPAISDEAFIRLCESGKTKAVEEAIRNGANVNAARKGLFGGVEMTALHAAANAEIAALLLNNGAEPDTVNDKQETALHWAARVGNLDVVEFLLKNGANANIMDGIDKTPLGWAYDDKIKRILLAHGAK